MADASVDRPAAAGAVAGHAVGMTEALMTPGRLVPLTLDGPSQGLKAIAR